MLYVYGAVVPGHAAPAVKGIDGAPVAVLEAAGLGVAVSELAEEVRPTRDRLAQHHRVTMALLRSGGVAPFRFGNVFLGEAELRQGLLGRAAELEEKLKALAGCVEMAVRITLSAGKKPESGTEYLLQKKRHIDLADKLRVELGDMVKDWRQELKGETLDVACLIDRRQVTGFKTKLAEISPNAEVTGPWPPSSFV
jgi:hypothetical protein